MLAVHRLLGDTEPGGDLLPGPSQRPRVADLEHLQPFGEYPQRRHRAQPNLRVVAGGTLGEFQRLLHGRQHKLTAMEMSTYADDGPAPLVPLQATFARSMMRRSRSSWAWLLRQMMYRRIMLPCCWWL